jgi:N-acyl-phosphatidylethanolamine-hydrolysing phospholipase D
MGPVTRTPRHRRCRVTRIVLSVFVLMAATNSGAPMKDGRFQNRAEPTERASFGAGAALWMRKTWGAFVRRPGGAELVPYDSAAIARSPSLTWIGHATFLVRMDGVTFLTDPVFSTWAAPLAPFGSPRAVAPGVPLDELPPVDFAVLSHDHYDHADLRSVKRLAARGVPFFVPRGLGKWVRKAGGTAVELDWWQSAEVGGVTVTCVPAQHFSGRSLLDGNKSLWAGWVVSGGTRRFYHAGDSGYSAEFAEIGARLGPIDLAAVPIGAYHPSELMHFVHATPEEALRIARDVEASRVVAMHFGTFDLADEPLDEPPRRFRAEAERLDLWPERAWLLRVGETRDW